MRSIEPPEPPFPWTMPAGAEPCTPHAASGTPAQQRRRALPPIAPADIAATLLWVVIVLIVGARLLDRLR